MLKLIDPDQALSIVLDNVQILEPVNLKPSQALGLILAEGVQADRDYPPFSRAMMDGYAVRLSDAGKKVNIAETIAAGHESSFTVENGRCAEIMTGAACPAGTEAVVQYEICERKGDLVALPDETKAGQNIADRGSECRQGEEILRSGDEVSPLTVAILAAIGTEQIYVQPKPSIALISTGDELASGVRLTSIVQIRDSNGPMLKGLATESGISVSSNLILPDNAERLEAAVMKLHEVDILILSGGVSIGKYDLVPKILEKSGAKLLFHKVTQKPGKPFLFAVREGQLIFGLPGNPLACHLGFHRYIAPAARKMAALPFATKHYQGTLSKDVISDGKRTYFQLVRIEDEAERELPIVTPLKGKGSADIFAASKANGYIRIEPDCGILKKGDIVEFEYCGSRRWQT